MRKGTYAGAPDAVKLLEAELASRAHEPSGGRCEIQLPASLNSIFY